MVACIREKKEKKIGGHACTGLVTSSCQIGSNNPTPFELPFYINSLSYIERTCYLTLPCSSPQINKSPGRGIHSFPYRHHLRTIPLSPKSSTKPPSHPLFPNRHRPPRSCSLCLVWLLRKTYQLTRSWGLSARAESRHFLFSPEGKMRWGGDGTMRGRG